MTSTAGILKILAIFITLFSALLGGFLPIYIPALQKGSKLIGIANSFAGGVILALGLLHILKDAIEKMEEALPDVDYPLAILFCVVGFSLILFVEKVFIDPHAFIHGDHGDHQHEMNAQELAQVKKQEEQSVQEIENVFKSIVNAKKTFVREQFGISKELKKQMGDYDHTRSLIVQDVARRISRTKSGSNQYHIDIAKTLALNDDKLKESSDINKTNEDEYDELYVDEKPQKIGSIQILLLLALSVHSILIGISLGLQDDASGTTDLFIAICAHKWADALTLGISLAKADAPKKQAAFMIIFLSSSTPIGIGIGLIIKGISEFIEGLFLSLSAGTFLYIATTEIIVEEFSISSGKIWKMIMFSIGITMVALLMLTDKD